MFSGSGYHHLRWCELCGLTIKSINHLRPNVNNNMGYMPFQIKHRPTCRLEAERISYVNEITRWWMLLNVTCNRNITVLLLSAGMRSSS